ncbi:MAG: PTS sugar transporter subunit IIA [Levilactobacillus sp.]|jgi:mannose/fructose/sorbose-specific phosphotransferase system IIA component|uniref:PTS sugar transporter subunit IIA n=1 Tax=Levilactobacillus sp. TaxID=2767919 RepID=UPI002583B2D9|nr:PTS sugar transporter subunit IIA [Levilactobacillus sp.]MCH4124128.1 PTS sugar transporter subunit IIA [Levilactobacillus sp.]MCI1554036.1 PTS sugar transporter subunit IIA [Levilactobacillus sp.]MCI1598428.1 PTS sugar transporter subunit IIA [Levilactobacillus sp.]MCI1605803.1 PTS sugar transporter subunit IIA [Levilactobacillus sp.]
MLAIIVTSHGDFARGILQSAEMIFGKTAKVMAVTLAADESVEDLANHYQAAIDDMQPVDELLFLVDLWGGSPFNAASRVVAQHPDRYGLVAGLNLPMLIEALSIQNQALTDVIPHLERAAQGGIRHLDLHTDTGDDDLL